MDISDITLFSLLKVTLLRIIKIRYKSLKEAKIFFAYLR